MASNQPGALRRFWQFLKRPHAKYSLLTLLLGGFIAGILFWGGLHTGIEMTNQLSFCISCHEMRDTVYVEYRESTHYSNRTGVRAACPDCHVPHSWGPMMLRKARASFELWGKLTGVVNTPAKFEAARMALATHEWERMKTSDSRECRNCHSLEAMSGSMQRRTVFNKHMTARAQGQTCIDCHKGIAHRLPKEYREPGEEE